MREKYLPAKEIWRLTGVTPRQLRYYRHRGYLKDIRWSPGGGRPGYDLEEVKALQAGREQPSK